MTRCRLTRENTHIHFICTENSDINPKSDQNKVLIYPLENNNNNKFVKNWQDKEVWVVICKFKKNNNN